MANRSAARPAHILSAATFAALGLACLPAQKASAATVAALSVPPDSFLNYHVGSLGALSREITLDPMVRARLAHHFHMTGLAITAYVQKNLVLKRLAKAGRYKVYCVSRSGREYFVMQHLAVGTPVFVLRTSGKPILKLACGNPMVSQLPPVASAKPKPVPHVKLKPVIMTKAAPVTPVEVASNVPTTIVSDIFPSGQMAFTSVPTEIVTHGGLPGWLAAIPVITGILSFSHGGHTGVLTPPSGTVTVIPHPSTPPAAVPEPSPAWVFAVGGLILAGRLIKRRI